MAPNEEMLDDDAKPSRTAAKPAGKSKGPLLIILIGVLVMTVTPLATYFVVRQSSTPAQPSAEAAAAEPAPQPIVMQVEPLVVNISGTRMTRVLRLQVHLVLSEARLEEVLKEMMPMVKDRIMATAGRRTLDEMEGVDDRDSLKRDIALEINSLVRNRMAGSVLDVAFSEFLIQ